MRILFVAMADSIHSARWINQTSQRGWDVHLFPAYPAVLHPALRNIKKHGILFIPPEGTERSAFTSRPLWLQNIVAGMFRLGGLKISKWSERLFAYWLAIVIRWLKPDIVHSLEIQHSAYLTLSARRFLGGKFPPWIVTNWGSDIYLFGRLAQHKDKIRSVLSACNYYQCECHRDVRLARAHGFEGEILPVLPVSGGFDLDDMLQFRQPGATSSRRLIMLKGYQNWAGRALVGLRAIERCADALQGYCVAVYLPSPDVVIAAELMSQATGIPVQIETQRWAREDILRRHGSARLSIGLSISDAISTSLLEAMVMGSFPIQSYTGCGDEWLQDGETGLLVPPEDPEAVAAAIRRAVTDDALVDRASELNAQTARERLDQAIIQPQVVAMYEKVAAQRERRAA